MPEHISGNMWELFENEQVTGTGGTIKGPAVVRVFEYPEIEKLLVQLGGVKVEVDGLDFEAAVIRDLY